MDQLQSFIRKTRLYAYLLLAIFNLVLIGSGALAVFLFDLHSGYAFATLILLGLVLPA